MKRSVVPASARCRIEPLEPRQLLSVVDGFAQSTFVDGLEKPTAMAFAPDGRLFVAEQGGDLRVVKDGALLPEPFLSLDVDSAGERGLLGVTFDPAFADNQKVYVHYTVPGEGAHNRVSRFTAAGDAAVPGSEEVLLDLPPLSAATNHNGGAIHFGPDGMLYVAVGDNADAALSQSLDTPMGKMLRVTPAGGVPADNPLLDQTAGQNQAVWATGLRNPFTFAFDPATGRMHVNDVGQSSFEEVNLGQPGANFGWPIIEGRRTSETPPAGYVDPLHAYGRSVGGSIAGGAFYRAGAAAPSAFPADHDGDYFFADFVAGFVKSIDAGTNRVSNFASDLSAPVDLDVGPDGRLYALEYVGRISAFAPAAAEPPGNLTVAVAKERPAEVNHRRKGKATLRVTNAGDAKVTGRITLRLVASLDDAPDGGDAVVFERERKVKLKPGKTKPFRAKFKFPDGLSGQVRLIAQVIPGEGVRETTTADNTGLSTTLITV